MRKCVWLKERAQRRGSAEFTGWTSLKQNRKSPKWWSIVSRVWNMEDLIHYGPAGSAVLQMTLHHETQPDRSENIFLVSSVGLFQQSSPRFFRPLRSALSLAFISCLPPLQRWSQICGLGQLLTPFLFLLIYVCLTLPVLHLSSLCLLFDPCSLSTPGNNTQVKTKMCSQLGFFLPGTGRDERNSL